MANANANHNKLLAGLRNLDQQIHNNHAPNHAPERPDVVNVEAERLAANIRLQRDHLGLRDVNHDFAIPAGNNAIAAGAVRQIQHANHDIVMDIALPAVNNAIPQQLAEAPRPQPRRQHRPRRRWQFYPLNVIAAQEEQRQRQRQIA